MRTLAVPLCFGFLALGTATAQEAPRLPEAFGPGQPGAGGVAAGTDLMRVELGAEAAAGVRCADGTPAVIYVRAARVAAQRDRWMIYLQGGGSCTSADDCAARWRGQDGNFGANKLSSRFAPAPGMAAGGVQALDPRNPFAGWNQVFVYYCSSDGWSGTAPSKRLTTQGPSGAVDYRIDFSGGLILDAVLDRLSAVSAPLRYREADGAERAMPDLDDAELVVFAGSSAGGGGVIRHADAVEAHVRRERACREGDCNLRFVSLVDASYGLSHQNLDHSASTACGSVTPCTYARSQQLRYGLLLDFWEGVADASCVAFHKSRGDEWRCADDNHVLEHHLAAPVFVRSDLQDALVSGNTVEARFAGDGVPIDRAAYGRLLEAQLRALPGLPREEPRAPGPLAAPGVFAPACGDHETLRSDAPTFRRVIDLPSGARVGFVDAFTSWLAGNPTVVVERFDPAAGVPSGCGFVRGVRGGK